MAEGGPSSEQSREEMARRREAIAALGLRVVCGGGGVSVQGQLLALRPSSSPSWNKARLRLAQAARPGMRRVIALARCLPARLSFLFSNLTSAGPHRSSLTSPWVYSTLIIRSYSPFILFLQLRATSVLRTKRSHSTRTSVPPLCQSRPPAVPPISYPNPPHLDQYASAHQLIGISHSVMTSQT